MKFVGYVFNLIKTVLSSSFGTLNIAELLEYDWDGVYPRTFWTGWCEFWGNPYRVTIDSGSHDVLGGWVDVRHVNRLNVSCIAEGCDASAVGRVDFVFQAAYSIINDDLQWFPADLRIDALVNGTTAVVSTETLDVANMSYMRLYRIVNSGAEPVICRAITTNAVRPVNTLGSYMAD